VTLTTEPTAVAVKHYGTGAYGSTTYGGILQPAVRKLDVQLEVGSPRGSWSTGAPRSSWATNAPGGRQWNIHELRE
jgi:hypothetical protein